MRELYNFDISEDTIKSMLEQTPEITELTEKEVKEKEIILETIGCKKNQIRNIISSNPFYLIRDNKEILELIKLLYKYKFNSLNILFDSNPYILNLETYEIENYINERKKEEQLEDIIDDLESNPYLFNEI